MLGLGFDTKIPVALVGVVTSLKRIPSLGKSGMDRMLETSNSLSIRLERKFHHSEKTMVGNPVKVSVDKSVGGVHVFGNVILSILG